MMKRYLTAVLAALFLAFNLAPALAVLSYAPTFPITPNLGVVQFLPASTPGTYLTLYTAGANGSKCSGMWLTSNDATQHVVTVEISRSAVNYGGVTYQTPTTLPGFATGVSAVNLMGSGVWAGLPVDQAGNPFFYIASGDTVKATYATAVTAAKVINIAISCADF